MLIVRDMHPSSVHRVPAWLDGCPDTHRQTIAEQTVVWIGLAAVLPPLEAVRWIDVGDGFQGALHGDTDPLSLMRARRDLQLVDVVDGRGRIWGAPVIYDADGVCQLSLGWGRDPETGILRRQPEPWQAALLAGAETVRGELLAGRSVRDIPIELAAQWLVPLLTAVYHLCPELILDGGLLDDWLVWNLMAVAAGHTPVVA